MAEINAKLWKPSTDLTKARFENEVISLVDLYLTARRGGGQVVRGRIFINCRIDGPAVLLSLDGVYFNNCHLGSVGGDIRKLLYKPLSDTDVTGAVPVEECVFDGCAFHAVGFTGSQAFIDTFLTNFPLKA
jgi:hypothetical protein